nr:FISUMP domain-containing protein [uncultured Draconibacterium sp.]
MKCKFLKHHGSIFLLLSVFIIFNLSCSKEGDKIELEYGMATDIDGNSYKTIQIGDQIWMAENLKTTTYNDGTPISEISNDSLWSIDALGAYCWYENDSLNAEHNGALYNWYAVATEKLCPVGWHVPTEDEWLELYHTLRSMGCYKLNSSGWNYRDLESLDFNCQGILNGWRYVASYNINEFSDLGEMGAFWLDREYAERFAGAAIISKSKFRYEGGWQKNCGFSIRCIKD